MTGSLARCLVFLFYSLTCVSRAIPHPVGGHVRQSPGTSPKSERDEVGEHDSESAGDDNDDNDDEDKDDDDVAHAIVTRLSSWMEEKRHRQATHEREAGDDRRQDRALPFVTLAYAQTLDGMIAAKSPKRDTTTSNLKLSSHLSLALTHRLRRMHDAVLVGGSTFLVDAPRLNVRLPSTAGFPLRRSHGMATEQPLPVVLDTRLRHLQLLLFDKVAFATGGKGALPDEIDLDRLHAQNPVICCSAVAARSFLDVLELFQDRQVAASRRKRKRSYEITVVKKIDEDDHARDHYLPIKITICVIQHKKHGEDEAQEVTLTLLPCPTRDGTKSLEVTQVLRQLLQQFGTESVMVEGGAAVLASFLEKHTESGASDLGSDGYDTAADCICATIVPKIIGEKRGLPAFRGLDVLPVDADNDPATEEGDCIDMSDDGNDESDGGSSAHERLPMMKIKDGKFVSLGPDGVFLGRL